MNAITQSGTTPNQTDPGNMVKACQRCANQYVLVWLKEGDDYNDFGDRYCPFCGLNTDEITASVLGLYPATDKRVSNKERNICQKGGAKWNQPLNKPALKSG
jgi:hypothetical protein